MCTNEKTFIPSTATEALEWITVLSAAGFDYRVTHDDDSFWRLHVSPIQAAQAWAEICRFECERFTTSSPLVPLGEKAAAASGSTRWAAFWLAYLLVLFFLWFGPYDAQEPMLREGAASAGRILDGEWWRCITALTLHADVLHLVANVLFILAVGQAVVHVFGFGIGVALMLGGGILGNVFAAWVSDPEQISVGASTMGFATLGMMSLHQSVTVFRRWRQWKAVWRRAWLPMASGMALLGMMGTGPRSDLAGHAFGFIAGALLVLPFSLPSCPPKPTNTAQWMLAIGSLILVLLAWLVAWHSAVSAIP